MNVYHHTKFENLEKIITPNGLSFRGSYYEEFSDSDYKWTKRIASRIIEQICKLKKADYDKQSSFKPIIISFGTDSESDYMWTKYAQQYHGIQLVLNYDIIAQVAYNNLDYLGKCRYMHKRGRIKSLIKRVTYQVESTDDLQSNIEAVSALIKPTRFKKENEVRYIRSYSKIYEIKYEDYIQSGDKAFIDSAPMRDDEERFVCFPKEALDGIVIGYKSSDKVESVKKLLQNMNYDSSKVFIRVYPQTNTY